MKHKFAMTDGDPTDQTTFDDPATDYASYTAPDGLIVNPIFGPGGQYEHLFTNDQLQIEDFVRSSVHTPGGTFDTTPIYVAPDYIAPVDPLTLAQHSFGPTGEPDHSNDAAQAARLNRFYDMIHQGQADYAAAHPVEVPHVDLLHV